MAREHELTARRSSHSERREVIIPGRVRVDDLNVVCTNKPGEACQVLHVVAPAQRQHHLFRQERQFGPERRVWNRRCVDFVPEIN